MLVEATLLMVVDTTTAAITAVAMVGTAIIGATLATGTDGDLVLALAGDPTGLLTGMLTVMVPGGALLTTITHAPILIILRPAAHMLIPIPTTATATAVVPALEDPDNGNGSGSAQDPDNGNGSGSAQDPGGNSYDNASAKLSSLPAPENSSSAASVINVAASTRTVSTYKTDADTGASHYRLAFTMQELPPARKEVQNVILALQAMPPDARQRQIDSGRYRSFSPEEINLLRSGSQLPITW